MNNQIYQHFRNEEREMIDQFTSYMANVEMNYAPVLTDFLNPRERLIMQSLIGKNKIVKMVAEGGHSEADRKRILIYPQYFEPEFQDFEIALLEVDYPAKFITLSHSQILGAIIHSGVARDVLGDIITDGLKWQLIVEKKIVPFLTSQLDRIGKTKVKFKLKSFSKMLIPQNAWQSVQLLVSSRRIDCIVASGYHLSRGKVKELIENAKVQLNWMEVNHPDYLVDIFDVISVRGYGRIRLDAIKGTTHKGKLKISVSIIRR